MAKKIEWLDNFAEKYAKTINKTASKEKQSIILDKECFKNPKVGDVVKVKNKLYKIADAEYMDEVGPGVLLMEMGDNVPTTDPLSMAMGTEVTGVENLCNVEPEMARTNPGNVYDLEDVRQLEVDYAEISAIETADKINKENVTDRTTVPGHYSHNTVDSLQETSIEEVIDEVVEEIIETETVENEVIENETVEVDIEDDVEIYAENEDDSEIIATRTNRILRRIMASKNK